MLKQCLTAWVLRMRMKFGDFKLEECELACAQSPPVIKVAKCCRFKGPRS
jgi:hypothetical protein